MRIDLPDPERFMKIFYEISGQKPEVKIAGITLDSREARPGDLFIATAGERMDGHQFSLPGVQRPMRRSFRVNT